MAEVFCLRAVGVERADTASEAEAGLVLTGVGVGPGLVSYQVAWDVPETVRAE